LTPTQLLALSDNDLGTYASGGFGPKKRNEFYVSLRRALASAAKVENEPDFKKLMEPERA
jgi:hypothetical protein